MYHVNGAFGQVRLANHRPNAFNEGLFSPCSVGWHRCNDLYRIDRPQGHEQHLILMTVDGCGIMRIGKEEHRLTAGTVALIPRHMASSYRTADNEWWEFYWIHPTAEVSARFLDTIAKNKIYCKKCSSMQPYKEQMEELFSLCGEYAFDTTLQLSRKVSELLHLCAADLRAEVEKPPFSQRAILYIEQHFREDITVEDIAQALFVSSAHLIRIFKKEVGCTPHRYLIRHRLMFAIPLLKYSHLSVKEIALSLGFSSASHFISSFRKEYGCTPTQYHG